MLKKIGILWVIAGQIAAVALVALALTTASAQAQSESGTSHEGTLIIVWGDPRPGLSGGETRYSLAMPYGSTLDLQMDTTLQNEATQYFGKRVIVTEAPSSTREGNRITIDRIELADTEAAVQPRATTGTRRVLYVLLRYQGDTQKPHSPAFFRKLTNPRNPPDPIWNIPATINGFFNSVSWGQLDWDAEATPWMALPHPKTFYANCGWSSSCANLNAIRDDGLALAKNAGFDLTVYDNINFVLNNDLDCCAWGGGVFYDGQFYGATWEPPWGQETGIYVHELGHSIGLPHSGWRYYSYDSPWDMMSRTTSATSVQCGTYDSANSGGPSDIWCTEPGSGYITPYQDRMGWIPPANIVVIDSISTQTVSLHAAALPLRNRPKMIKVCLPGKQCDGPYAHYLTVEARIGGAKYDDGLPGDGVIIHDFRANRRPIGSGDPCFFNTQSGWAVTVDATPGDYVGSPTCSGAGLSNAQFQPGDVFRKAAYGIKIRVLRKQNNGYVVRVIRSQ